MNEPAPSGLEVRGVSGSGRDGETVRVLTASFALGRFHLLRGPQGGGKAALLRWLGLLQIPEAGEVFVHGNPTRAMSDEARAELRAQRFGFVFAAPFLLGSFTVIENVAMPLLKISRVTSEEARRRTENLLAHVGLADAAQLKVDQLSLLAQYQVAVARGLVNEPSFLLVEDVDGALAGEDLHAFVELLHRAGAQLGTTIIATASPALSLRWPHRVLDIAGGAIADDVQLLPEAGA